MAPLFLKYQHWKLVLAFLFNVLLCFIGGVFFVWWSIALISFVVHFLFNLRSLPAFFSGFISLFLLWSALTFYISAYDDFYTSELLGRIFILQPLPWVFNFITGLIAGFLGAFSAVSAAHLRRLLRVKYLKEVLLSEDTAQGFPDGQQLSDSAEVAAPPQERTPLLPRNDYRPKQQDDLEENYRRLRQKMLNKGVSDDAFWSEQ